MFEEPDLVQGASAASHIHGHAERVPVGRIDTPLLIDLIGLADMLRRHVGPLLGQVHHRPGVHEAVTEFVGDLPLHPVEDPAGFLLERRRPRREHHQVLHVPPGEARVRLECQRGDSSGQRRRGGSARVLHRANVIGPEFRVHVHGGDALVVARRAGRVGRGEGRAAFFQVPRFIAALRRARDGQREDAVGVAVAVARVRVTATVTGRPHEDGALALATLFCQRAIKIAAKSLVAKVAFIFRISFGMYRRASGLRGLQFFNCNEKKIEERGEER